MEESAERAPVVENGQPQEAGPHEPQEPVPEVQTQPETEAPVAEPEVDVASMQEDQLPEDADVVPMDRRRILSDLWRESVEASERSVLRRRAEPEDQEIAMETTVGGLEGMTKMLETAEPALTEEFDPEADSDEESWVEDEQIEKNYGKTFKQPEARSWMSGTVLKFAI